MLDYSESISATYPVKLNLSQIHCSCRKIVSFWHLPNSYFPKLRQYLRSDRRRCALGVQTLEVVEGFGGFAVY